MSLATFLVPFPFTDQMATKRRPAVVVSSALYHRERSDLILMAITGQARPSTTPIEVAVSHWKKAGLLKPSVIKPVFTTVERRLVLRRLGRLEEEDRQALQKALQVILGE